MKTKKWKLAMHVLGGIVIVAALGIVFMLLWNWLIPVILGLPVINYWQALGLLVLSRILFGGFGFGHRFGHSRMRHHHDNVLREKWGKMTPEEKKEFVKNRMKYMHGHGFGRHDFYGRGDFDFEEAENKSKKNG